MPDGVKCTSRIVGNTAGKSSGRKTYTRTPADDRQGNVEVKTRRAGGGIGSIIVPASPATTTVARQVSQGATVMLSI